jgi:hypothetical protein
MEGRNKSISYYFTQINKNDVPCKLDFLKISDNNQSYIKTKSSKNLNRSEHKIKSELKRPSSSSQCKQAKSRICEKMKENSFNTYMQNSRNIRCKGKDFNANSSVNISFTRPINTTTDEVTHRTLDKIKVYLFKLECKKYSR